MIGIICAMKEEAEGLKAALTESGTQTIGGFEVVSGRLAGREAAIVQCGIGKVNAAAATAMLACVFKPEFILNSGVAGGISENVKLLDIVVADKTVQYDYDLTVFGHPLGHIPDAGRVFFDTDKAMSEKLVEAFRATGDGATVHTGTIATGDRFVSGGQAKESIRSGFGALACDMESAAVGHAASCFKIPYIILRSISDSCSDDDYERFLDAAAARSIEAVKRFFALL